MKMDWRRCLGMVSLASPCLPLHLIEALCTEIAHNLAHHAAESMSRMSLLFMGYLAAAYVFGVPGDFSSIIGDLVFKKPGSRKQEVSV